MTALISPIARGLLRIGLTPNAITVIGATGSSLCAVYFFGAGDFFLGTILVSLFILSDLFDGTMARLSNQGSTKWGALIDSTLDRVSDAAIFIGIIIYAEAQQDSLLLYFALLALLTGALIPYVRAKAESLGVECSVGVAERTERLIVALVGTGMYGLGLESALLVSLALLAVAGIITVFQRLLVVARAN